jgi:DNA-binding transcriptional regulator YdaS (Cro superfamily)
LSPDVLRAAGEALYGAVWQSALAHALGVNPRTLRRWLSGEIAIGAEYAPRIAALLRRRRGVIDRLLAA